jgi:hypothetical protein
MIAFGTEFGLPLVFAFPESGRYVVFHL